MLDYFFPVIVRNNEIFIIFFKLVGVTAFYSVWMPHVEAITCMYVGSVDMCSYFVHYFSVDMKPMKTNRVAIKFPVLLKREFYNKRLNYRSASNWSNSGFIVLLRLSHCCCRCLYMYFQQYTIQFSGARGSVVGWGTMLQARRSRDWVQKRWILSIYLILPASLWPWGRLSL
jgi:hypothetical protein